MKFYVNEVHLNPVLLPNMGISEKKSYVGLFTSNEFRGEGYCCGWYGAELYVNTTLIAIYEAELGCPINLKNKVSDVIICNTHFDKITIGSIYWEKVVEADSVEDAIKYFSDRRW